MDYFKVLIVASSGKGKTTSAKDLDRDKTQFINTENKPLPFKGNFKHHIRPKSLEETREAVINGAKDETIDVIFIDSLSAIFDMVLLDCRKKYKGFDVWNAYNESIANFIDLIKRVPKTVFITAHYEILGIEGSQEKRVKVKGRELEGVIEKDFTIVVYADSRLNDKKKPEYYFNLFKEGTSAKCPPDIFGEEVFEIPNNCAFIQAKLNEFLN